MQEIEFAKGRINEALYLVIFSDEWVRVQGEGVIRFVEMTSGRGGSGRRLSNAFLASFS